MPRKVIRIRARDVEAGDALVVQEGRIKKYYHICEVYKYRVHHKWFVEITYNGRRGAFEVIKLRGVKPISIREEW